MHLRLFPIVLVTVTLALGLAACGKKPAPAPEPAPTPASAVSVEGASAAEAPPTPAPAAPASTPGEVVAVEVDYSKMSNEDKYLQEMASSVTTYIQDHLRNKGRMPRDLKDLLALKIMDRLDVPDKYLMVIDQKTGVVSFKKLKR